jgi:hypothetical protein
MFRTIIAIMALAALLATAACTDITGPETSNPTNVSGSGGGHRQPQERQSPDLILPDDPGAGGSGSVGNLTGDIKTKFLGPRRERQDRSFDDNPGAGGDPMGDVNTSGRRGSRGDNGRSNP